MTEQAAAERTLEVTKTLAKRGSCIDLHIHIRWPKEALEVQETLARIGCLQSVEEFFKEWVEELETRFIKKSEATIAEWQKKSKKLAA